MSYPTASSVQGVFSPIIWSQQAIVARESMLVMAKSVMRRDVDVAKSGYQIKFPSISNLTAQRVGQDGSTTPQYPGESASTININQWFAIDMDIPDIVLAQSDYDLFSYYTEKMGYGLGVVLEDLLIADLITNSTNSVGTYSVDFTDANLRRAIQYLDDARVPQSDRHFVCAPSQKANMLGIDKFVRANSIAYDKSSSPITDGALRALYGMDITSTPEVTTASGSSYANVAGLGNLMFHKDAEALAMQKDIKVEKMPRQKLSDRVIAQELFGFGTLRADHSVLVKS